MKSFEVETFKDVAYYNGPDAHEVKHKLDLFVPKGCKDYPILFFVHGGAWRNGDKKFLGIYSTLGTSCAQNGIGAAVINYRLSPSVTHPEHVKDVARAFAWVHRTIRKYQGDPAKIFVCGHSAGGHLIALLATNEKFLKAEGLTLQDIRGAIPMSGVYRIPEKSPLFTLAFGTDEEQRKDASPLCHIHDGLPPFLLVFAESELPYCGKPYSEEFCKALKAKNCAVELLEIKNRNHISLIANAIRPDDPVSKAVRDFIQKHTH